MKGPQLFGRSLRGVYFVGPLFGAKADFNHADLRRAAFQHIDLRGASFERADLEEAGIESSGLRFAKFLEANLTQADFDNSNIQDADFRQGFDRPRRVDYQPQPLTLDRGKIRHARNWFLAHFDQVVLRELKVCDLEKACDHEDRLRRRDFSGIDLTTFGPFEGADFAGANLQHTSLRNVIFGGADLSKADLRHADLNNASLGDANIAGADLRGADLRKVDGLTRGQIESALTDADTLLPSYLAVQKPFTPKR